MKNEMKNMLYYLKMATGCWQVKRTSSTNTTSILFQFLHNVEFSRNVAFNIKELASVHDKNLKLTLSKSPLEHNSHFTNKTFKHVVLVIEEHWVDLNNYTTEDITLTCPTGFAVNMQYVKLVQVIVNTVKNN